MPTSTNGSRGSGARSPIRCSPRPAAATSSRSSCTRRAWRTARDVWPQVTPRPLTMQFTHGRPVQPQHRHGVRRAAPGRPRGAHRRLPRSRVAARAAADLRALADEAALGDVRGLRVAALPRARRAGGSSDLARERGVQPARRDVRAVRRRGPADALPRVHRQRRRRGRRSICSRTSTWRWVSPTPVRTSTSCATHRCPPICSARWVRERSVMPLEHAVRKLTGEPADMFGFVASRLPARRLLGRRVRVRSGRRSAPGRRGACATSRPTESV